MMSETHAPAPSPGGQRGTAGKAKRRRVLPKVLIGVAALLVVAIGAGTIYAASLFNSVAGNITRENNMPAETPTEPGSTPRPEKDETTGAVNYVLLGSDTRDPDAEKGRSDSIMVVHLSGDRKSAYITSFPRDMWVDIPGYGKNKINAAYAFGGSQLTVTTLEGLLGVRMDHLAIVDFLGFIGLTEDLGGVTVNNTQAFSSHGFTYPKGKITIQGDEALWFVRERKSLANGDLDRAKNQRKVLQAILKKGLSGDTIKDPAKFTAFVGGLAKHVTVDQELTDAEIRDTALSLRLTGSDVQLLQAPISGFDTINGQSVDVVDEAKLKELKSALKKDKMAEYLEKYPEE